MTKEELFEEFAQCFSVMVDRDAGLMSNQSYNVHYYEPEDRCGGSEGSPSDDCHDCHGGGGWFVPPAKGESEETFIDCPRCTITQPLVELGEEIYLEPSDVEEIEVISYYVKVKVKDEETPYHFMFLYAKNFETVGPAITI